MRYEGTVEKILFEKHDFYILSMDILKYGKKVVTGQVSMLKVEKGVTFIFEAEEQNHLKYGKQLSITKAPIFESVEKWNADMIFSTLSSMGVSSFLIDKIRDRWGSQTPNVFSSKANFDKEASFLSEDISSFLWKNWEKVFIYNEFLSCLYDLSVPSSAIEKIWKTHQENVQKILYENPWKLIRFSGVDLKVADAVAERLQIQDKTPRNSYAILERLREASLQGDLFLTATQMIDLVKNKMTKQEIAQALKRGELDDLFVLDRDKKPTLIYEHQNYKTERESLFLIEKKQEHAKIDEKDLRRRLSSVGNHAKKAIAINQPIFDCLLAAVGDVSQIQLTEKQIEGVAHAVLSPISILTGLPGTGKSTSLKTTYKLIMDLGYSCLLAAPTGVAAKRLSVLTGGEGKTIHKAFQGRPATNEKTEGDSYLGFTERLQNTAKNVDFFEQDKWAFDFKHNPYKVDYLIVDESSMLDQNLFYRILKSTAFETRIIFVGDAEQLPSVGAGNVLRDLIDSNKFPTTYLDQIFRQKETSGIVTFSHDICKGRIPTFDGNSDVFFTEEIDEKKILSSIVEKSLELYEGRQNFQAISPKHLGVVGVTNLNRNLREKINPHTTKQIRVGKEYLKQGDRIMVTKNNYDYELFNGDIGKIDSIDTSTEEVTIKIFDIVDRLVVLPLKEVSSLLRLSYCTTVHKCQGLEFDHILMPILNSFSVQLQKNLLYTAITRAKKKVYLFGEKTALERAIKNDSQNTRNSKLCDLLKRMI